MLTVSDVSLQFAGSTLYKHVDLKFTEGNCYGIIGANGAGKSTLLRILSGELEPTTGSVSLKPGCRMSVLEQDHFKYDDYTVMETVLMGNPRLYAIMKEKDELYNKPDFSDADGERAAELEGEFAEMGGWEAESDAAQLLNGLGLTGYDHYGPMSALDGKGKVKVLLAKALFGHPNVILLDEPTNGLDLASITWLEEFLMDYDGTVIVVSHDRHFLNAVCTHTVDIDYGKVKLYAGNYDFWYDSSRLMQQLIRNQNKKKEEKIKELQAFIQRFSANKSKSKQATSRKKILDSIQLEELPASSRKYPFVQFTPDREAGKDILFVEGISKTIDGVKVLDKVTFTVNKFDKIALVGENEAGQTALMQILAGEMEPDEGSFKWGVSTTQSYFPKDNTAFFEGCELNLIEWLRQYSPDPSETYLRGFLGRMLFSGDEVLKPAKVLSGGEKVRCMLSRMMMNGANVILLDQPTDHLDLESIAALTDGIEAYKGNVLLATHDHQLIDTVANRIIELAMPGESGCTDYAGTFEEYLQWKANRA
ncbi:MAG TPA: ATP-binding cassette domain-containing protein [Candidatus Anaerofilum faecale]|nr:ABC-F family ATP-binding cassette domain-containing protein [Anaerofilum sp. An201]OUP04250.1 ABC transporter ATP-binding protein [Anaerofilum sp. An201]HIX13622.1 ATP-binding cassette domain-containing protein [Candidatus Anaerofilum faecale]